jgi:hypothetical protein
VAILDSDAFACFTVIKYLKGTRYIADREMTTKLESPDVADQIILAALNKFLSLSRQNLVKRISIPPIMVW